MKKTITFKLISLLSALLLCCNTLCLGLAPICASVNPIVKQQIKAALHRTQIRYAESDIAKKLLAYNKTEGLLLSSGSYLVTKEVAEDDLRLLRAIYHEDIEALMQILANQDSYTYQIIKRIILSKYPYVGTNELSSDIYVNHTLASAFEWLLLIKEGIITMDMVADEKKDFVQAMEQLILTNNHYFKQEMDFWDYSTRAKIISKARVKGMRFYQVASDGESKSSIIDNLEDHIFYLGQDVDVSRIGNKARSFITFEEHGLPFPEGFVLSREVVQEILNDNNDLLNAVIDKIIEDFNKTDTNIDRESISLKLEELKNELTPLKEAFDDAQSFLPFDDWTGFNRGDYHQHGGSLPQKRKDPAEARRLSPIISEIQSKIRILENKLNPPIKKIEFAVRSSPVKSIPGILKTELNISSKEELFKAVLNVCKSWEATRAIEMRKHLTIDEKSGMGIIIQRQIKVQQGNSGPGVAFSWNPDTGTKEIVGDFALRKPTSHIVSGEKCTPERISFLQKNSSFFPGVYEELVKGLELLENVAEYPQEVEFVVENTKLYFLQTRNIRFAPRAEIKYLDNAIERGIITKMTVATRLEELQKQLSNRKLYSISQEALAKKRAPLNDNTQNHYEKYNCILEGSSSTPGAMAGKVAFSIEKAEEYAQAGEKVILVLSENNRAINIIDRLVKIPDIGLILLYGNSSAHESVLARYAGIPVIISAKTKTKASVSLKINYTGITFTEKKCTNEERNYWSDCFVFSIREGAFIIIDGDNNEVYLADKDDDVVIENSTISDASFGIDIIQMKKEFTAPYLNDDDATIIKEISYEDLLEANIKAYNEYVKLAESLDDKEAFLANLRKHFLHEMFLQKAEEIDKSIDDAQEELMLRITAKDQSKETVVETDLSKKIKDKIELLLESEFESFIMLLGDTLNATFKNNTTYAIEYDTFKLSTQHQQVIEAYIELLNMKVKENQGNSLFVKRPFSSKNSKKNRSILNVQMEDSSRKIIGKSHININTPPDYFLEIIRVINIALARASIPIINKNEAASDLDFMSKYGHIIGFIKNEYTKITGHTIELKDVLDKSIDIILPEAHVLPASDVEKYYTLLLAKLRSA